MAYDTTDLVTVAQLKKNAQKTIALAASLEEKINNRIAGVHTYGGTKTFAQLTNALLDKAHAGYIYNISDDFTTTSDFVEGAGKKCTAGTNVGVAEVSAAVYTETSDDTVNAEKTYYESRNGGYAAVTPAGNEDPSEEGWYELTTPATYKFDVHAGDLSNLQTLAVPTAARNLAGLDENGQVIDLDIAVADDAEVDEMLAEVYGA